MSANSNKPSLQTQLEQWLAESCLREKDLPGYWEPQKQRGAYRLCYSDIDGEHVPEDDIWRLFTPVNGFKALTVPDPEKSEPPKYLNPAGRMPRLYFPPIVEIYLRKWVG